MIPELYSAIKTQLQTNVSEVLFIAIENGHLDQLRSEDYQNSIYIFPRPAVLIEFQSPLEIAQLGNGNQIYDPLFIRVHVIHEKYNDLNGNQEENLEVFTLSQKIYSFLQGFEPLGAVAFVRTSEEPDYNHDNLYHLVQTYQTNYIDSSLNQPVNPVIVNPPIALNDSYTFTPGL